MRETFNEISELVINRMEDIVTSTETNERHLKGIEMMLNSLQSQNIIKTWRIKEQNDKYIKLDIQISFPIWPYIELDVPLICE